MSKFKNAFVCFGLLISSSAWAEDAVDGKAKPPKNAQTDEHAVPSQNHLFNLHTASRKKYLNFLSISIPNIFNLYSQYDTTLSFGRNLTEYNAFEVAYHLGFGTLYSRYKYTSNNIYLKNSLFLTDTFYLAGGLMLSQYSSRLIGVDKIQVADNDFKADLSNLRGVVSLGNKWGYDNVSMSLEWVSYSRLLLRIAEDYYWGPQFSDRVFEQSVRSNREFAEGENVNWIRYRIGYSF